MAEKVKTAAIRQAKTDIEQKNKTTTSTDKVEAKQAKTAKRAKATKQDKTAKQDKTTKDDEEEKVYFNALGVPSDDEVAYLDTIAGSDMSLMRQYMPTRGKFLQNETGRLAMVILAIYNLYVEKGLKLYFSEELTPYVLPAKDWVLDNPLTYVRSTFEGYQDDNVIPKIVRFIEWRWQTSKITSANVRTTIADYLLPNFQIDPFMTAVEKAYIKMVLSKDNNNGWDPLPLPAFYDALSHGISNEMAEPYRLKIIHYLLKTPLILRWKTNDGRAAYTGGGIQAMPIIYGRQGLGKSTLVRLLGLGWANSIKNLADTGQENIYKRAMNAYLDYGELAGMKKADLEDLKTALTQRFLTFNPKYSNGLKTLPANALIIGTTNFPDLLKDLSGERRFWPFAIVDYDYNKVTEKFILRAYATEFMLIKNDYDSTGELPSLNVTEDNGDRKYKQENYGQADRSVDTIGRFIADLVNDKGYYGTLYFGKHGTSLWFGSKRKIDKAYTSWCDEQKEINSRVSDTYPSKVTNFLLGLPSSNNAKVFKIGKDSIRGISVSVIELADALGIDL